MTKTKPETTKILPQDKTQALNTLIKATQALIDIAERETRLLAQNDMMGLHILQDEKKFLTVRYEKLSTEFRSRLEEFRGADPGLLDRLEKAQHALGKKTRANNEIVGEIFTKAKEKTQNALLTVQELSQQKPVRFNGAHHAKQQEAQG